MNTDSHNWHPSTEIRNDETSEEGGKGELKTIMGFTGTGGKKKATWNVDCRKMASPS
jgi:hypothetical protein